MMTEETNVPGGISKLLDKADSPSSLLEELTTIRSLITRLAKYDVDASGRILNYVNSWQIQREDLEKPV